MNLSLYLLAGERVTLDGILAVDKLGPGGFEPLPTLGPLPFPARAFLKKAPGSPPEWRSWVAGTFDLKDDPLTTQAYGCVILFLVGKRAFAACFGSGWTAISREMLEPDFGLIVALHQVDPTRLRHLVTKTLERRTRERSTYRHGGGGVSDFAVDVDVEWLRFAGGKSRRTDCSVIAGADSLKITGWNGSLRELHAASDDFLRTFGKGVPSKFNFANNLRPLKAGTPRFDKLEAEVLSRLHTGNFDGLSIGIDSAVALRLSSVELSYRGTTQAWPDLDDDALPTALDALAASAGPAFDRTKVHVRVLDEAGDTVLDQRLERLLQAEIKLSGHFYVRIEGTWFHASRSYVKAVNEHLLGVEDWTAELKLPAWRTDVTEEDYNAGTATKKGWLLQDQVLITAGGGQIEPCDILTKNRELVCVKEGKSSASLSHLFAQASGSADLLAREPSFRSEVAARYKKYFHAAFHSPGRARFVLAIGRPAGADLFGKMFLSKLTALEHVRRIRALGFDTAFCRIDLKA